MTGSTFKKNSLSLCLFMGLFWYHWKENVMVVIVNYSLFSMIILLKHVMQKRLIGQNGVLNTPLDQLKQIRLEGALRIATRNVTANSQAKKGERLGSEKQSEKITS